ncbi:hypothetical protein KCW65_23040, partial [Mycobacterium tuberculosis]|nr:hypothetical protein [Mycobacterium tuberculosis]
LSTFRFYREGLELAAQRLRSYVGQEDSAVLDEPATEKALARDLRRGMSCGAHTPEDIAARTDMSAEVLEQIARTGGIATEMDTRTRCSATTPNPLGVASAWRPPST